MDIADISVVNSQASLMRDIGTAVLSMSLDTVETTGENMVKMMEQSVNKEEDNNEENDSYGYLIPYCYCYDMLLVNFSICCRYSNV